MILQLIFSGLRKNGRKGNFIKSQRFQSFCNVIFTSFRKPNRRKKALLVGIFWHRNPVFCVIPPPFFGHETHEKGISKISAQPLFPHFLCLALSPKMGLISPKVQPRGTV